MKAVIQRVSRAEVHVNGRLTGSIGAGLMVLLGIHLDDGDSDVRWMADKLVNLRIFEDSKGLMNLSLRDTGGAVLIVSQFTLMGDCRRGRRPSWSSAAPPEVAQALYLDMIKAVRQYGIQTETGEFQAMMDVSLNNNGPVTILLDSHNNS